MRFNRIEQLEKILEIARTVTGHDDLAKAIEEYDLGLEKKQQDDAEWLKTNGDDCEECGRKFSPRNPNWPFCSIGCRYAK